MQLGMIGLGRMGANMTRRLVRGGHAITVFDLNADRVREVAAGGAPGAASLAILIQALAPPRAVWLMVPAGDPTERMVSELATSLQAGDAIIDGGNSLYKDDVRRARGLGDCARRREFGNVEVSDRAASCRGIFECLSQGAHEKYYSS